MQTPDQSERLSDGGGHDETPSNTNTHTHTNTHTVGTMLTQYLQRKSRGKQLKLTRVQWFQNNAIIRSVWIDLGHTRMRK